jgi:hypothetical protein
MDINTYIVLKDIFNSIDCKCFEGYYIAKINISKVNSRVETSNPSYKKIDRRNIIILKSYEVLANSAIYEIHITYFKPLVNIKASISCLESRELDSELKMSDELGEMIKFDNLDMKWFYDNCSDDNSIHFGENPVIPAVVLLKKINQYLNQVIEGSNSVSIKFYEPIYLLDNLYMNYIKDISLKLTSESRSVSKNKIIIHGVK